MIQIRGQGIDNQTTKILAIDESTADQVGKLALDHCSGITTNLMFKSHCLHPNILDIRRNWCGFHCGLPPAQSPITRSSFFASNPEKGALHLSTTLQTLVS